MSQTEPRGPLASKLPPHRAPPELEERVVETLAQRGLIARGPTRQGRGRLWRAAMMVAASILLFAAGALSQRVSVGDSARAADSRPRYMLLLYGGRAETDAAERARVDEYRRWAQGLATRGQLVAAEKLADGARELTALGATDRSATDGESLAGFFVVSASTPSEAESIARTCPHLRHGGRVVVRAIEGT